MKSSQAQRYERHMGYFCSCKCFNEYRKMWFRGENNHQFGLKGKLNSSFKGIELKDKNNNITDILVYAPSRVDANKRGRVPKHRLLVEENWEKFPSNAFFVKNGQHVLKKGYDVHHIDGNHDNNDLTNLAVLTRKEHVSIHNKQKQIVRDGRTGRIVSITQCGTHGYGSTGK